MLGHSRYLYLEFTLSQAMGAFLRAMDRALVFFGGCTHADVFDNMKTVVLERDAYGDGKHRFNPAFFDSAKHAGFRPRLCSPYRAQTKEQASRCTLFERLSDN